jgi:hypothetical protein
MNARTAEEGSADLLGELATLRARTRADRRAYAFPLFLFGALILVSPLVYVSQYWSEEALAQGIQVDQGPFPQFFPLWGVFIRYPELVGWFWAVTVVGGLWLTAWWYRRHARLRGVATDVRVPIAAAGAALLGFVLWEPMLSLVLQETTDIMGLYSTPAVNLPILFVSAALSVAAFVMARRADGWMRTVAVFVGTFLAAVAFGAIGVYLIGGYAALMVIGAALVMLAWWERSTLLFAVSVLFLVVSVPANHPIHELDIATIYGVDGWDPREVAFFSVLAPGAVLVVGGVLAVLRNRR